MEVDRIKAVYQEYALSGLGQSKWSRSNEGNRAIRLERERKARQLMERGGFFPLIEKRILDLGCGMGEQLERFLDWGARAENLCGIDLIPDRIRAARRRYPQIAFEIGNAESLPYANGAFDLVAVFTVFTSILDSQMAINISREINRVLAPGGAVLWYDFRWNNPFNRHVRGMSRRRIQSLFRGFGMALQTVSLLPPLARRLGRLTDRLYTPLQALPLLRTHWLGLLTKPRVNQDLD